MVSQKERRGWNNRGGIPIRLVLALASFLLSVSLVAAVLTSIQDEIADLIERLFGII